MGTTLPTQRKTTTAYNLAAGLAYREYKTLLVDIDPQGSSTVLVKNNSIKPTGQIGDALVRGAKLVDIANETNIENLYAVHAGENLYADAITLNTMHFKEQKLKQAVGNKEYDFIIIDCPSELSALTINALYATDYTLIPCEPGRLPVDGMGILFNTIETIRGDLRNTIVFWNMHEGKSVETWSEEAVEDYSDLFAKAVLRKYAAYKQAQILKEPVFVFSPKSKATQDFNNLIEEVLDHVKNDR